MVTGSTMKYRESTLWTIIASAEKICGSAFCWYFSLLYKVLPCKIQRDGEDGKVVGTMDKLPK